MKNKQKIQDEKNEQTQKKYQQPRVIHTSKIETLAGSCVSTTSCVPNFS